MSSYLKRPFNLGKLQLPSNIFCAPLAGCSDVPFRRMTSAYQPGLIFCEMVKMDALVRQDQKTFSMLAYEDSMHPIGAQLCGSKPSLAADSARIIEELGFDVIDFNCGCPVDKVTRDGSGSAMLRTPELIGEILANIISAVKIPVTLKIRAGWNEEEINVAEITQIAEKAGAKVICIHGRTREQAYRGNANWAWIAEGKKVAKQILVFGNGDLFDAQAVLRMFQETDCDGVMISRGTMGQPWIIEDVYRLLSGQPPIRRSIFDMRAALLQHLEYTAAYHPERKATLDMRRIGAWYLKNGRGMRKLREALNHTLSIEEVRTLLREFSWEDSELTPSDEELSSLPHTC